MKFNQFDQVILKGSGQRAIVVATKTTSHTYTTPVGTRTEAPDPDKDYVIMYYSGIQTEDGQVHYRPPFTHVTEDELEFPDTL